MIEKQNEMETLVEIQYFGKVAIDINQVEHDYQTYSKVGESLIEFNLNYEPQNVSKSDLLEVNNFLEKLDEPEQPASNLWRLHLSRLFMVI